MRCWIASGKRWGDSEEVAWELMWHKPPTDRGEDWSPDDCEEVVRWFKTEDAAMKAAASAVNDPANWYGYATVQKVTLEQIDGDVYDWERVGEAQEVCK